MIRHTLPFQALERLERRLRFVTPCGFADFGEYSSLRRRFFDLVVLEKVSFTCWSS